MRAGIWIQEEKNNAAERLGLFKNSGYGHRPDYRYAQQAQGGQVQGSVPAARPLRKRPLMAGLLNAARVRSEGRYCLCDAGCGQKLLLQHEVRLRLSKVRDRGASCNMPEYVQHIRCPRGYGYNGLLYGRLWRTALRAYPSGQLWLCGGFFFRAALCKGGHGGDKEIRRSAGLCRAVRPQAHKGFQGHIRRRFRAYRRCGNTRYAGEGEGGKQAAEDISHLRQGRRLYEGARVIHRRFG